MQGPVTIAVFTPTYNRAHTLARLYVSLQSQTVSGFTWIIVDDGSTDDTQNLVRTWIDEDRLEIQYLRQENAGKMAAINTGVEVCDAELFFIVDSDDWLTDGAVERVGNTWRSAGGPEYSGIVALRGDPLTGDPLGGAWMPAVHSETLYTLSALHGLRNDVALIYRTDILRQHPFPIAEGEKFVPEGYIWSEIDKQFKLIVLNEIIYQCQYLDDGYSAHVRQNQVCNPKGFMLAYRQQFEMASQLRFPKRAARRARYSIGIFALSFITEPTFGLRWLVRSLWVLLYPVGLAAYLARYRRLITAVKDN